MPQKDGTGPRGQGPKTGRGIGNCTPKSTQQEGVQKDEKPVPPIQRPLHRGCGVRRQNNS